MNRWALLWILLLNGTAFAGDLEPVIVPPPGSPQSGSPAEFSLYLHHTGGAPLLATLPEGLTCRIEAGGRLVEVSATAIAPAGGSRIPLVEGGFARQRYRFTVPEGMSGPVRLTVREFAAGGTLFLVAAGPPPAATAAGKERPQEHQSLETLMGLHQPYLLNFSAYEAMYFLVGTDPEKSKFQISFKYRFLNPKGPLVEENPWLSGLHLGYTQTSFWNLKADSAPFDDTSYKPELFFVSPNATFRPTWMKGLFLQTGFMHESNGRSGPESRSTNFLYLKPVMIFYDADSGYGMALSPRVWAYVGNDGKTNPDLKDYRGYFELALRLGKEDGFVLDSRFRWAAEGASTQLDLTYPLRQPLFRNLDLFLHAQYVNTLAESLLRYRERTEALRLGVSIVR